jgi:hypothetical protein
VTARWYDNNTRKSRLTEMKEYAKEASKYLHDGCSVLEVAPGPGYLAIELAELGICNDNNELSTKALKYEIRGSKQWFANHGYNTTIFGVTVIIGIEQAKKLLEISHKN